MRTPAGQSEEMLGKALGARRKDVVIATKVGFRTGDALIQTGLPRKHIHASAEGSLRRLAQTIWTCTWSIVWTRTRRSRKRFAR